MNEPKTTSLTRAELASAKAAGQSRTAVAQVQASPPYVWDGIDEDDRPLGREEMQSGIEAAARSATRTIPPRSVPSGTYQTSPAPSARVFQRHIIATLREQLTEMVASTFVEAGIIDPMAPRFERNLKSCEKSISKQAQTSFTENPLNTKTRKLI